jgi:hypothetical protein
MLKLKITPWLGLRGMLKGMENGDLIYIQARNANAGIFIFLIPDPFLDVAPP